MLLEAERPVILVGQGVKYGIDPDEIDRNYPVALGLMADVQTFLRQVLAELDRRKIPTKVPPSRDGWLRTIDGYRKQWEEFIAPGVKADTTPIHLGILGLDIVADAKTEPEMSSRLGGTPHGYRIVRLQTPYGERIKLVQPNRNPPNPNPVPQWIYERHGFAYLTFVIEELSSAAKHLQEHGVKLIGEGPVEVRKGVFALYSSDPEGNYVEFVEYPDIAAYRPDLYK